MLFLNPHPQVVWYKRPDCNEGILQKLFFHPNHKIWQFWQCDSPSTYESHTAIVTRASLTGKGWKLHMVHGYKACVRVHSSVRAVIGGAWPGGGFQCALFDVVMKDLWGRKYPIDGQVSFFVVGHCCASSEELQILHARTMQCPIYPNSVNTHLIYEIRNEGVPLGPFTKFQ